MLPGVCPGVWMIRGEPGTSSTSLSATVRSSVAGLIRSPPRRAEYHRKPASGPILTGPQPELGFLTFKHPRSTCASSNVGGDACLPVQPGGEADVVGLRG